MSVAGTCPRLVSGCNTLWKLNSFVSSRRLRDRSAEDADADGIRRGWMVVGRLEDQDS